MKPPFTHTHTTTDILIPRLTWNHQSGTSTRHGTVRFKHGFDWFWPFQWQTTRQRYHLQKID